MTVTRESTDKPSGGPAFPAVHPNPRMGEPYVLAYGMSLRDYFAAHAMAAYVAKEGPASDEDGAFVAMYAYQIADAMIAERSNPREGGV